MAESMAYTKDTEHLLFSDPELVCSLLVFLTLWLPVGSRFWRQILQCNP
jgi:hypothetical protein